MQLAQAVPLAGETLAKNLSEYSFLWGWEVAAPLTIPTKETPSGLQF